MPRTPTTQAAHYNVRPIAALMRALMWAPAIAIGVLLGAGMASAQLDGNDLREDAPLRYVVKKGDTLWDISQYFLKQAWFWPELWYSNPDIANPHLIYPGDVLLLEWVDGHPRLRTDRVSPRARPEPLESAIPTIPIDAIRQFLKGPRVVGKEEMLNAPYVVEFAGEHLIGAPGMRAYAIKLEPRDGKRQMIVRDGQIYKDPQTEEIIGYEAIFVGEATVEDFASTSTLKIDSTTREVLRGDRLLPNNEFDITAYFHPRPAPDGSDAQIISVYDGVSQIGQFQIVTLNRGKQDGLEPGHVMRVYKRGRVVPDPHAESRKATIRLPEEEAGMLMVFKTYERVSYGLIMKASRAIHINDKAVPPRRR